jgi:hypothetical protein
MDGDKGEGVRRDLQFGKLMLQMTPKPYGDGVIYASDDSGKPWTPVPTPSPPRV